MNTEKEILLSIRSILLNEKIAIGKETLIIDGTVKALTVSTGATYALIAVESDASNIAIRYWENGTPSTTEGIGRGNSDAFDINSAENLKNFKVTQAQAGTHTLQIQYFK